jgi:hypothetical protein
MFWAPLVICSELQYTDYFIMCLSKRAFEMQGKTDSKLLTDAAFICDKTPMTAAMIREMIKCMFCMCMYRTN